MYSAIDEEPAARSARELRAEADRLAAEHAELCARLIASEARVASLRAETKELAENMCVILKTVRRELKRKDSQRAELEASAPPRAAGLRASSTHPQPATFAALHKASTADAHAQPVPHSEPVAPAFQPAAPASRLQPLRYPQQLPPGPQAMAPAQPTMPAGQPAATTVAQPQPVPLQKKVTIADVIAVLVRDGKGPPDDIARIRPIALDYQAAFAAGTTDAATASLLERLLAAVGEERLQNAEQQLGQLPAASVAQATGEAGAEAAGEYRGMPQTQQGGISRPPPPPR